MAADVISGLLVRSRPVRCVNLASSGTIASVRSLFAKFKYSSVLILPRAVRSSSTSLFFPKEQVC